MRILVYNVQAEQDTPLKNSPLGFPCLGSPTPFPFRIRLNGHELAKVTLFTKIKEKNFSLIRETLCQYWPLIFTGLKAHQDGKRPICVTLLKTSPMNTTTQFEFYDRERKIVRVGTFRPVSDIAELEKGQLFIVPPDHSRHNGKEGCCEGRTDVVGYRLPIALYVKSITSTHVNTTKGYGSWFYDCCYIENI